MLPAGPAAAVSNAVVSNAVVSNAAASGSGSGSTAGIVSILIGVVIIVATARWTYLYRQANKAPVDDAPPPPVRRLGADVDWWRENAGGGSSSAVDSTRPERTRPPAGPDQSSTN